MMALVANWKGIDDPCRHAVRDAEGTDRSRVGTARPAERLSHGSPALGGRPNCASPPVAVLKSSARPGAPDRVLIAPRNKSHAGRFPGHARLVGRLRSGDRVRRVAIAEIDIERLEERLILEKQADQFERAFFDLTAAARARARQSPTASSLPTIDASGEKAYRSLR